MNGASGDLRVDLVIDDMVARRAAGRAAAPAHARPGSAEALIAELAELGGIDRPADEVGDRIAMGFNNGRLAWISAAPTGRTTIRVDAFPKDWPAFGVALSCATGTDCFLETSDISGSTYSSTTIEVTRDGGLTWSSLGPPIAPGAPQDVASSLSCPVAAGCVAIASDTSPQPTWVVLSNLRNGG